MSRVYFLWFLNVGFIDKLLISLSKEWNIKNWCVIRKDFPRLRNRRDETQSFSVSWNLNHFLQKAESSIDYSTAFLHLKHIFSSTGYLRFHPIQQNRQDSNYPHFTQNVRNMLQKSSVGVFPWVKINKHFNISKINSTSFLVIVT